jgi:hypothetical protein
MRSELGVADSVRTARIYGDDSADAFHATRGVATRVASGTTCSAHMCMYAVQRRAPAGRLLAPVLRGPEGMS